MLQPDGFVNGDFMSGILRQVDVQDKCFTTAYQSSSCDEEGLLAVGTTKGVALYETVNYTRIQLLERGAMVSSLEWIQFLDNRRNWLLVVADVKGCVTIYHIDTETVESPGPTLLTEWTVHAEVRAVSAVWIGFILVVGVGDKKGKVTLTEFDPLFPANAHRSVILQEHDSAVLGMALTDKFQAVTTEAGMVVVHEIRLLQSQGNVNAQERQVFVQQRSGPVRAATFSPDSQYLAVGGYDKRVVLIDTEQWAVARELHLQGTVSKNNQHSLWVVLSFFFSS
jgi:WD40 repeat protein